MAKGYSGGAAVRPMEKALMQLVNGKYHDVRKVFEGFLDYIIFAFDPERRKPDYWPFDHDDCVIFHEALQAYIEVLQVQSERLGWYDAFGDLYMSMHNHGNDKGQFFTPPDVCSMMARVECGDLTREQFDQMSTATCMGHRAVINDFAAGSGRLPLATYSVMLNTMQREWGMSPAEARYRRPYLSCEDLDYMCVKMAAINICVHGAFGEAVCHDSLKEPEAVHLGYIINEMDYPLPSGVMSIRRVTDPSRFACCRYWAVRGAERERERQAEEAAKPKAPMQLSLW